VPLCAIGVVLCAFWPAARRRLSLAVLVLSVFSAAMVPVVQASGDWLEDQVGRSMLLERHTQLGDDFLPYAIALVIGAGAVAALRFMEARSEGKRHANTRQQAPRWMVIGVVVALLTATAAGYQIFEVGDSGSAAAWSEYSTR
jgi:hypothetical protein